jgi:hypothetical protein
MKTEFSQPVSPLRIADLDPNAQELGTARKSFQNSRNIFNKGAAQTQKLPMTKRSSVICEPELSQRIRQDRSD